MVVHVDAAGREQAARCGGAERVLERYSAEYLAWAQQAGRPLAGAHVSTTCPPEPMSDSAPRVTFPLQDQTFAIDPDGPARQEILLTAESSAPLLRFIVDGQASAALRPPFRLPWRLSPGTHRVSVATGDRTSAAITFEVTAP
jgi:hypothetical protein